MRCVSIIEAHKMFYDDVILIYDQKKYKRNAIYFKMKHMV
jgi:hypothetical protein